MAKVIVVLSQKGGVGKTTIADELAFYFERKGFKTAFLDYDGQGGAVHENGNATDAEVIVVDTPGRLDKNSGDYIRNADLVVIPTLASPRDVPPLMTVTEMVRKSNKPYMYVINRADSWRFCRQFNDFILEGVGGGCKRAINLPQAQDFIWAADNGMSVVEFAPKGKAAERVTIMGNIVKDILGLEDKHNG